VRKLDYLRMASLVGIMLAATSCSANSSGEELTLGAKYRIVRPVYLVGAYKYYEAAHSGPKALKMVCLPDPQPSRDEAIQMFMKWAKAHPQHMQESPVETEFRFLMEKWPCN